MIAYGLHLMAQQTKRDERGKWYGAQGGPIKLSLKFNLPIITYNIELIETQAFELDFIRRQAIRLAIHNYAIHLIFSN